MKFLKLTLLATILSCLGCGGGGTESADHPPTGAFTPQENEAAQNLFMESQARIMPAFNVSNGLVELDDTALRNLNETDREAAKIAASSLNELIDEQIVTIDADLAVYATSRANQNGWTWRWYGGRLALDSGRTSYCSQILRDLGVSAFIASTQIDPRAGALVRIASTPLRAAAWLMTWLNRFGRGIYIHFSWFSPYFWMEAQP